MIYARYGIQINWTVVRIYVPERGLEFPYLDELDISLLVDELTLDNLRKQQEIQCC
jgi:hypothetical protein